MTVDVSWGGVSLAKGANARAEDGGWFVELEQPMPVGTKLQLDGEVAGEVEVARVHEGVGAGMLVKKAGATAHVTASAAADEPDEKEAEKENGGGGKKEKRRKKR